MKKISVVLLIILFTISSCSRLDLAVNLANSYITNKADDFFDLTWDQKSWLKESLSKDITTIKKTIFPLLATEMLKMADLLSQQKNFEPSKVSIFYSHLEGLYYDGLKVLNSTATNFVDRLSPTQIDYFQKEVDKKFLEMKEHSESKSYKKMKKNFDSWMGGMTSKQKNELKEFNEKNPSPINEIIKHRQNLVHEFINAYPDLTARRAFINKIFTNYDLAMSPSYKQTIETKNKKVVEFFTHILNTISEKQKQTLIDTIKDRANQIMKISKN